MKGLRPYRPSSSSSSSSSSSTSPTTTFFLFFFLFPVLLILSFPSQLAPPSHLFTSTSYPSSSSSSSSSSRGLLLVSAQCNGSHLVFTGSSGPYGQVGAYDEWYRVTDAVSLEVWINPTTIASSSYDGIWGNSWKAGATFDGYSLFLDACGVNFLVGTAATSDARVRLPIPYGKWSYIVATYSSATGRLEMYLNGKFMTTGSPQSGPINYREQNELWIGRFYALQDDRRIRARLDGYRLWNRVLNASEVADYFANPRFIAATAENKLLTSLNFDEAAGSALNDGTGQHNGFLTDGENAWENATCSADCSFCVPTVTPTHTPSTVNYTFNYNPFNWVDPLANNHTEIPISVQPTAAVPIGFNFTFFDSNFSSVYMDTSGLVFFIRPAELLCIDQPVFSTELPGQNGISACFSRMSPGKLYATTILDTNTNLRVFVVSWIRWALQGTGAAQSDERSFQVKLFEDNSRIEIHYYNMSASPAHDRGGQASVGLCEAVPNDVPISEVTCYLRGWNRNNLRSGSSLIICRTDDPATVLCAGIPEPTDPVDDSSSDNSALIAGIVGGLGGFLFLFIYCVICVGLVWFLGYRGYKWNRARVPYLEAEMEDRAKAFEKPCKEIAWEDLEIMELLGTGAFGKVYKAKWRGAHVAVKVCTEIQLDLADNQTLAEIKQEASLMEHLGHHPNVVSFFGTVTKGARFAMVTEFCAYGSLFDLLIAKKQAPSRELTREMVLKMLRGVARGILYLHEERVIHRDISARNVLVAKDFTVRISDFGLARLREDSPQNYGVTKSNIGPVRWMAPEAIINRKYSEKSDAWSYGVLIWEVVTQSEPWANIPLLEIAVGVGKKGWRLKIPKNCDPFLAHLMRDCWKQEPAERPSFKEIEARFSTELAADDTEGEKSPSDEEDSGSDSDIDMEMPADMRKREEYDIKMDVFKTSSKRDLEAGTSSASSDD